MLSMQWPVMFADTAHSLARETSDYANCAGLIDSNQYIIKSLCRDLFNDNKANIES